MPAIANFLREYADLMENDENVNSLFDMFVNSPQFSEEIGVSPESLKDETLNIYREAANELENNVTGEITIAFFVGANDRLLQLSLDALVETEYNKFVLGVSLNTGASATDTWRLNVSFDDGWDDGTFTISWEIRETDGRHINVISADARGDDWAEKVSMTCDWNPTTGVFALTTIGDGSTDELFKGNFIVTGRTFRMQIDYENTSGWSNAKHSIEISTSRDANIDYVNYVNLGAMSANDLMQLFSSITGASAEDYANALIEISNKFNY